MISGPERPSSRIMERMRGRWLALALAVVGCATGVEDEPPATTFGIGDGTLGNTPTNEDTDAATSEATGGSGMASGTGQSDETGGGETSSVSDESSSGGATPVCIPDEEDLACVVCAKTACCEEYLECIVDAQCNCALECLIADGEAGACILTCGASAPALDLFTCAAIPCELSCYPPD